MTEPAEIVRCLLWDFYGDVDRAIRYADGVAGRAQPELAAEYAAAAAILRARGPADGKA